ncbi:MAG: hypothetical protein HWE10_03140 [Gammaproteobacteria bacterium]|nr:hypothetical protein [Gammaproteobacteria bacterium]
MKKIYKQCLPLLTILAATNADAELRFNGFASIHGTQVTSDGSTPPFPEYNANENFSFKEQSLFALQASADLGEGLSATVQFVSEGKNNFNTVARWAYLSYQLNDNHMITAGKLANPIFYQSEYEQVGFAHNFARLPKAVYIGLDFSTIEGIALDSTFYIDNYTLTTKVLYGSWAGTVFLSSTGQDETLGLEDVMSVRGTLSGDWWNIYAGTFISTMVGGSVDTNAVLAAAQPGVTAALAAGATQAQVDEFNNTIKWGDKDGIYSYAGFNVDLNNFLVDFEITNYGVDDSSDAFNTGWYLSAGYRVRDDMTVTVHTEKNEQDVDLAYLDGVSNPILYGTGKAISEGLGFREFEANGVSVRYDFHPSAALKVDFLSGEDTRPTVGDYTMMTVGIDMVF